jgi:hypothetical protein
MTTKATSSSASDSARSTGHRPPRGMIVVLTYPHVGDEPLTKALSASPSVACTHGTGLLAVCQAAITTWRNVENRDSAPSPLAVKSVRSLVSTMASVILSGTGATQWCETASTGSTAAATFLRIFPETTFLCLYRSLPTVIAETARAYPWGLGVSPLWPYSAGHPGNNLATIVEYWTALTRHLADFEAEHPQSCLAVRHEDLAAAPGRRTAEIFAQLGLDAHDPTPKGRTGTGIQPDADPGQAPTPDATPQPYLPLEQAPERLLAMASELHTRVGYGPLDP